MSKTASECIVKVPDMPTKSADSGRKEISKKKVNFFTSPNLVLFPDIVDGNVSTEKFLDAYAYLISIYDLLGSFFETIVKLERMNHENVVAFYNKDTKKHRSIKDMLLAEKATGKIVIGHRFIHMMRTMKMLNTTFQSVNEEFAKGKKPEVNKLCYESFKKHINPYHNFFYRQLFKSALLVFLPDTDTFIKCLHYGEDFDSLKDVLDDANSYLSNVQPLIEYVDQFYIDSGLSVHVEA